MKFHSSAAARAGKLVLELPALLRDPAVTAGSSVSRDVASRTTIPTVVLSNPILPTHGGATCKRRHMMIQASLRQAQTDGVCHSLLDVALLGALRGLLANRGQQERQQRTVVTDQSALSNHAGTHLGLFAVGHVVLYRARLCIGTIIPFHLPSEGSSHWSQTLAQACFEIPTSLCAINKAIRFMCTTYHDSHFQLFAGESVDMTLDQPHPSYKSPSVLQHFTPISTPFLTPFCRALTSICGRQCPINYERNLGQRIQRKHLFSIVCFIVVHLLSGATTT